LADINPGPKICRKCGKRFNPELVRYFENTKWFYPGLDRETNLCEACGEEAKREVERKEKQEFLESIKNRLDYHLERAGVPPKYRGCSLDNFKPSTKELSWVLNGCLEYAQDPKGGLFLYGAYGTGKTHLAVAIARELILQGKKVEFVYTPRLLIGIRKAFQEDAGADELSRISHYSEGVPYLILDDIGVEKTTEWARQTLDLIFYERDAKELSTVITSNLSPDEIAEKIDPRISSRLAGMGKILPLIGPDYRVRGRRN